MNYDLYTQAPSSYSGHANVVITIRMIWWATSVSTQQLQQSSSETGISAGFKWNMRAAHLDMEVGPYPFQVDEVARTPLLGNWLQKWWMIYLLLHFNKTEDLSYTD